MHDVTLRVQALRPALASGARGALPLVGGRGGGVITMLGCQCGKCKHNASNASGVTASKMGRNSSVSE